MSVAPASGVTLQSFVKVLDRIWAASPRKARPSRVGLAVSGGVDSMALASLCSRLKQSSSTHYDFTAFIVDHNLRPNSGQEAKEVKARLRTLLGISSRILTINPVADMDQLEHLESYARQQRYRAIGKACKQADIDTVLVAHHGDDVGATILQRLYNRYYGLGLGSPKEVSQIPECYRMHGIDQSGRLQTLQSKYKMDRRDYRVSANMSFEGGGIQIVRPLLEYSKADLVATCVNQNVSWVEDPTNRDVTFTMRNTIRYLQEQDVLPAALSTARLQKLRDSIAQQSQALYDDAHDFLKRSDIRFEPRGGCLRFVVPLDVAKVVQGHPYALEIKARMLQTLFSIVSCRESLEIPQFKPLADLLFLDDDDLITTSSYRSVASVIIHPEGTGHGGHQYLLSRTNPFAEQRLAARQTFEIAHTAPNKYGQYWSAWHLWDGRYWIRVGQKQDGPSLPRNLVLRHLSENDMPGKQYDSSKLSTEQALVQMRRVLRAAKLPSHSRLSLPVLATSNDQVVDTASTADAKETVVALPSLGWSSSSFQHVSQAARRPEVPWIYDIRYKKIPEMFTQDKGKNELSSWTPKGIFHRSQR